MPPALRPRLDDAVAALALAGSMAATSNWSPDPDPTPAQAAANAYRVGRFTWQGLPVCIENPAHSVREGTDPDGKAWRSLMAADYGYFAGTVGADGDGVDVFLGPFPESDQVWILNQQTAAGAFDEHKVLAGFTDAKHATDAYRMSYSPGWSRFDPPIPASLTQLRQWLKHADKGRPFSLDLVPPETDMNATATADTTAIIPTLGRVFWDSAAEPAAGQTWHGLLYGLRLDDAGQDLMLDALTMGDVLEGQTVERLDALVVQAGKLQSKMLAFERIMNAAGSSLQVVATQLSDLVKRFGGVHVAAIFELSDGQTITAWFHNPDQTPNKFSPADDLVSWKWQLNKKDVTIVVAPENGEDLNLREVARRLMKLAAKNSAAFAKANAKRADTMQRIAELKAAIPEKQATLQGLLSQIEVAKMDREDSANAARSRFLVFRDGDGDAGRPAVGFYASAEDAQEVIDDMDVNRAGAVYAVDQTTKDILWSGRAQEFIKGATFRFANQEEFTRVMQAAVRWANKERGEFGTDWILRNMPAWIALGWRIDVGVAAQALKLWFEGDAADLSPIMDTPAPQPEPEPEPQPKPPAVLYDMEEVNNSLTDLAAFGQVQITDIGSENVYFEKDGKPYYTKLLNTNDWAVGPADFSSLRPGSDPEPAADSPDAAYLRDVARGAHDGEDLGTLLSKLSQAVMALSDAGLLAGDADKAANDAITHWVELDQAANG